MNEEIIQVIRYSYINERSLGFARDDTRGRGKSFARMIAGKQGYFVRYDPGRADRRIRL